MAQIWQNVQQKIAEWQPEERERAFSQYDALAVPNMNYKIQHHFKELETNELLKALQTIEFRLDRSGAVVASEADFYALSAGRRFTFTRPFLIALRKRGSTEPYFVMWVDNAQLLCKPEAMHADMPLGQKIELAFNYEPGAYVVTRHLTIDTNSGTADTNSETVRGSQSVLVTMDMNVDEPDAHGNRKVTTTLRHVKSETSLAFVAGGQLSDRKYDSATDAKSEDTMNAMFYGTVGMPITMIIDPKGKISQVRDANGMIPDGRDSLDNIIHAFPDKPVGKGDTWGTDGHVSLPMNTGAQIRTVYTLEDIKNGVATVTAKMTMSNGDDSGDENKSRTSMEMSGNYAMQIDVKTGLLHSFSMTQKGTFARTTLGIDTIATTDTKIVATIKRGVYKAPKTK